MRLPIPLPLNSKYHMFCSLIIKQSQVCKIGVHYDPLKNPILLPTVSPNPCDHFAFQLMVFT